MNCRKSVPPLCRIRAVSAIAACSLMAVLWAAPAAAQLSRLTTSIGVLSTTFIRGTDVAYDPVNGVYLLVGGYGPIYGAFTNTAGQGLTAFNIGSSNASSPFGHFPRAEYSAQVNGGQGGFLVTWHQNDGSLNYVHSVLVAYPTGVISANVTLSDGAQQGTKWEAGAAIAYSPASQRFLVAWQTFLYGIQGRLLDVNGNPIGGVIDFENPGGARDPGLAYNAATNEFGLSYSGWDGTSPFARFRRINILGGLSTRTTFGRSTGTFNTDVEVNPTTGNYVMAYATGNGSYAAEFDAAGNFLGSGLISTKFGGSDNLALAYNDTSGTFLTVGQHVDSYEIAGAELNSRGVPMSAVTILTSGSSKGSFYPRLASRGGGTSQWNIVYSRNFTTITNQIIGTSSTAGGPFATLGGGGAAPPTTGGGGATPPVGCIGSDPFASIGGGTCVNGGWQPPSSGGGGGGGSTGGCPGSAPFPGAVCQNGGWVPGSSVPGGGGGSTGGCPGSAPFPGAVCQNGGWVPGSSAPGGGGGSTGGCPGSAPFPGAVCVNGGWVPGSSAPGGGGGSTGGCPGSAPFPGAVCVNGGWVPGSSAPGGGGSTGGCPGSAPFAGAVCVNGGWVPGSPGTVTNTGCSGSAPFAGAVCVNGGWVPDTSAPSSGGTCATPNPFPASLGGVCINGGWVPGNSSLVRKP